MILRSPKTLQGDPAEHHGSLIDARVFIVLGLVAFSWEPTTGSQPPQPDAPKRFEIASIRPNKSGDRTSRADYKGETLTITNRRVRDIIRLAYGIGPYYTVPQATVEGEPQWVDDRYDIIAKTPGPVASGLPSGVLGFGPPLNVMLQALRVIRARTSRWSVGCSSFECELARVVRTFPGNGCCTLWCQHLFSVPRRGAEGSIPSLFPAPGDGCSRGTFDGFRQMFVPQKPCKSALSTRFRSAAAFRRARLRRPASGVRSASPVEISRKSSKFPAVAGKADRKVRLYASYLRGCTRRSAAVTALTCSTKARP
jgi:hypothetical protein